MITHAGKSGDLLSKLGKPVRAKRFRRGIAEIELSHRHARRTSRSERLAKFTAPAGRVNIHPDSTF
jgi:hypothetical protein